MTPEEKQWVKQFALRIIAEFNLLRSMPKEDSPDEIAAA